MNEALARLDALTHLSAASRAENDPPAAPPEGARWIVGPAPTGDWTGHAGEIAILQNGGWSFAAPVAGMIARIADENASLAYDGSLWTPLASGSGALAPALALLEPLTPAADQLPYYVSGSAAALTSFSATGRGIVGASTGLSAREFLSLGVLQNVEFGGLGLGGATPDATNRLAVASPAVLFNHAGAGVQFKINKANAAATGSLLFQTNWSGRAEMGLAGSDDWSLKTSANGSAWINAITVAAATGELSLAQDLGVAHGGTGASTAEAARANLDAASAADLLRGGAGNMAMTLEAGEYVTRGYSVLLAGDPAIPAGLRAPVLRIPGTGANVSVSISITPERRSSASLARASVARGDVFGVTVRAFNGGSAGRVGLNSGGYTAEGASAPTLAPPVSSLSRGEAISLALRAEPSATAVEEVFYLTAHGIPVGGAAYFEAPYLTQIAGYSTASAIRRAATSLASISAAPAWVGQTAQVGGVVHVATGTASASDWRAMAPALRSYTVATLPSPSPAMQTAYVSNGAGNKRLAVSDGSVWRWPDGTVVA